MLLTPHRMSPSIRLSNSTPRKIISRIYLTGASVKRRDEAGRVPRRINVYRTSVASKIFHWPSAIMRITRLWPCAGKAALVKIHPRNCGRSARHALSLGERQWYSTNLAAWAFKDLRTPPRFKVVCRKAFAVCPRASAFPRYLGAAWP
jgi:hypothetical protein